MNRRLLVIVLLSLLCYVGIPWYFHLEQVARYNKAKIARDEAQALYDKVKTRYDEVKTLRDEVKTADSVSYQ